MLNLARLKGFTQSNSPIVGSSQNTKPSNKPTPKPSSSKVQSRPDAIFTPSTGSNQATDDLNRFRSAQLNFRPGASTNITGTPVQVPIGTGLSGPAIPSTTSAAPSTKPAPAEQPTTKPPSNPVPLPILGTPADPRDLNSANIQAVDSLAGNFEAVDTSGDGFVSEQEIRAFRDQQPATARLGLNNIANAVPELMFTTIQEGDDAFFGLGREDLQATSEALRNGESLEQIQDRVADELADSGTFIFNVIARVRGLGNRDALRSYVRNRRDEVNRRRMAASNGTGG